VGGQQHDGHCARALDLPQFFQHFLVDVHPLVQALEQLVQQPGHRTHHRHSHLPDQPVDYPLRLNASLFQHNLVVELGVGLAALGSLSFDGLEDSAGGKNLGPHFSDDALALDGYFCIPDPLEVGEVGVVVHAEQVGVVDGQFDVLLEDVLLDAVVVELDVLGEVDLRHVDQELLALVRRHELPQVLEVAALEDPLVQHEELEDLRDLLSAL
jgi:hypothetical protein